MKISSSGNVEGKNKQTRACIESITPTVEIYTPGRARKEKLGGRKYRRKSR